MGNITPELMCVLVLAAYRVRHLKPWIHQAEHVIAVTGLQANNVINDIIHLQAEIRVRSKV